jgi:hypothetical protein
MRTGAEHRPCRDSLTCPNRGRSPAQKGLGHLFLKGYHVIADGAACRLDVIKVIDRQGYRNIIKY